MPFSNLSALKDFLDQQLIRYNAPDFIEEDPIVLPHAYTNPLDIEIAAFFAAILAWGKRKTIILKGKQLFSMMDDAPYDFIMNHRPKDLDPFLNFKHRTFNATDTLYFIQFLRQHYQQHNTLETTFITDLSAQAPTVEAGLVHFHQLFFSLPNAPIRTRKHVATPARNAACKRLNMFLRWMVRSDNQGVDFGIWKRIKPHQLICPCDVHVSQVSRKLGLMQRPYTDWQAALELTQNLRLFCPEDPVKYDFALFGLGRYGTIQ
ncbi:MAG: TIGR02757 family protein [Candidatus Amoebophilus sp. 36-38]|nr:MAG: TIGR02757 family protein [Candidatus Amoebophilus sp. 36-38]